MEKCELFSNVFAWHISHQALFTQTNISRHWNIILSFYFNSAEVWNRTNENSNCRNNVIGTKHHIQNNGPMSWKSQNVNQQQGHWHSKQNLKCAVASCWYSNSYEMAYSLSISFSLSLHLYDVGVHILTRRSFTHISFQYISFTAQYINYKRSGVYSFGFEMWMPVCHGTFKTITYRKHQLFIFRCVILRLISSSHSCEYFASLTTPYRRATQTNQTDAVVYSLQHYWLGHFYQNI